MKFLTTKMGKLTVAFVLLLLAFPVSLAGLNTGADGLLYGGLVLILIGLGIAPAMKVRALLKKG